MRGTRIEAQRPIRAVDNRCGWSIGNSPDSTAPWTMVPTVCALSKWSSWCSAARPFSASTYPTSVPPGDRRSCPGRERPSPNDKSMSMSRHAVTSVSAAASCQQEGRQEVEQAPVQDCGDDPAFDVPPEHIVQSSSGKGWQGLDVAEIIHPLDDFTLPALPRHILVINLSPPSTIQERLAGRQGHLGTGKGVILPAGAPTTWHLEREAEVRHLHLYHVPTLIQEIASEADIDPETIEFAQTLGIFDPQIETIQLSLLSELRSEGLGGRLYVESLATILGILLLRQHSSVKQPSLPRD